MRPRAVAARARRAAARMIVWPPIYPVAARVPRTTFLAARAAFRTGRDELLESTLDRLDRRSTGAATVLLLRADLRTFQGRYADALHLAEHAAARSPSASAAARIVKLGYRVRNRAEADRAAIVAVAQYPRSAEALWPVAMACDTPEQYQRVVEAWAARTDPQPTDLLLVVRQLTVAAGRAGQPDAATGWYRQAIELLLGHGQQPPVVAGAGLAGLDAWQAIVDLCRTLDDARVPFFFAAGTALGLIREGRPLGADRDIDVGILDGDWSRDALIELFTRDPQFDIDLHPRSSKVGLRHRGGSPVDIFRFYRHGGKVWHDGLFVRWHNSPFRVARREVRGLSLPLPADPGRYLSENYGDWRTPRPGFDAFTSDAPNLEVTWPAYHRSHLLRRSYERLARGSRVEAQRELELAGEPELAAQVGTRGLPNPRSTAPMPRRYTQPAIPDTTPETTHGA